MNGAIELAPGLWRIMLPFHLELNHVNSFLMRTPDGFTLVDCGYGTDEALEVLKAALSGLGLAWRDIARIIITHTHPDHVGNAARVVDHTGAEVLMHEQAMASLARFTKFVREPQVINPWLISWGIDERAVDRMAELFLDLSKAYRPVDATRCLDDGETLDGWTAICTPGHAPGHLCLYDRGRRLLISGDHVLEAITPNIAWVAQADSLADYIASLDKVARLDVAAVFPSHGDPFTQLEARCRQLALHHQARCDNILAALEGGRTSAQQVVERLWRRVLSPFQHRFAIFEVMAHLKYMENRGRAECDRSGHVEFWRELPGGDTRNN